VWLGWTLLVFFGAAPDEPMQPEADANGKIIGIELVGPTGQKPCQV
jgi:hypothetical protein